MDGLSIYNCATRWISYSVLKTSKRKKKLSNLEHYRRVWDDRWEYDMVSQQECGYNVVMCIIPIDRGKNIDDNFVVQMGKLEKKDVQQI